jgi:hypothetical protein
MIAGRLLQQDRHQHPLKNRQPRQEGAALPVRVAHPHPEVLGAAAGDPKDPEGTQEVSRRHLLLLSHWARHQGLA